MAIRIEDPEVEALLETLCAETGESRTHAARTAFAERLARLRANRRHRFLPEVLEMIERGRSLPVLDLRPSKEIEDELWGD